MSIYGTGEGELFSSNEKKNIFVDIYLVRFGQFGLFFLSEKIGLQAPEVS